MKKPPVVEYTRLKSHTFSNEGGEEEIVHRVDPPQASGGVKPHTKLPEKAAPFHKLASDELPEVVVPPVRKSGVMNVDQASTANATHTDDFVVAKYSRFLHDNVTTGYSKVAAWAICSPLLILYFYLLGSYYFETWAVDRFSGVTTEVNSFDCEAYYFWVVYLHGHYVNIKRTALEGLFMDDVMDKYGYFPPVQRISEVMANTAFQDKLWQTDSRQAMNTYKSNYSSWYDQQQLSSKVFVPDQSIAEVWVRGLSSTFLPYMFYNNDTMGFEMQTVNARDGSRYITRQLNIILSTDVMDRYPLGPSRDKKNSPYEHVVRWNLMNPTIHYYRKRRFSYSLSTQHE